MLCRLGFQQATDTGLCRAARPAHCCGWCKRRRRRKVQKHFALGAAENLSWKQVSFELVFITSKQK